MLAAGLWLWTLVANVASDGSAAPLPYLPLLNPLDIGIGIALAAMLLWLQQRSTASRRLAAARWPPAPASSGSTRCWCAASTTTPACPTTSTPGCGSLAVQTGITLLWTVIALVTMWFGVDARCARALDRRRGVARRGRAEAGAGRSVRHRHLTRIVSFIGVGVLMLVIGYVAPLPAKEARHVAA